MCLIAIAHRASERFPLVIAANRDEDYRRPTLPAQRWPEDGSVIGGRDQLHGGAWLAISASGRFAAVTNLRGATPPNGGLSRGFLVRDFLLSDASPETCVASVAAVSSRYAGFHLIAGEAGASVVHFSRAATELDAGVHGLSNAAPGERWPKVDAAVSRLRDALEAQDEQELARDLLTFLSTRTFTGSVESEVFISSDLYGTRSSSVVIVTRDEVVFYEQGFAAGGIRDGELRRIALPLAGRLL